MKTHIHKLQRANFFSRISESHLSRNQRTYALLLQNWNSEKLCLCGFISVVESVITDELNIWWLQCQ